MDEDVITVLHLEDDPADAELVSSKLGEAGLNFRISVVQTRDEFEAALSEGAPDIILADFHLPTFDGMSALRIAKALRPHAPFVFVSGTMGEEAAIEGLTQGGTDYVLKQNLARLPAVVRRALREARDRMDRIRAEDSVRKLSQAIEQSPVSIVITDPAGTIEFVNSKLCEVTGYTRDEALGQNPRMFKSGETPREEYARLWATIKAGGTWRGELHNRKKSGELFWEQATIAPVRDSAGAVTHYVAVKEDVTEKKKLEEQLRLTQKMEAIGQLAGGVAHDFNNMLGVILGSAEMALESTDRSTSLYEELEQIVAAARRSADITRKLLIFARKQTIRPTILDLNEVVEGMLSLLRRLIGENVSLVWSSDESVLAVKMDSSQVDQMLANLCLNAKDAISGIGKITIETRGVRFDEAYCCTHEGFVPGEFAMVSASDDGCGMDRATMGRIFEPFFTTKGPGKGTGLGLATVYGIVKQNEGFINVSSEPGQGSTFRVFLPRQVEPIDKVRQDCSSAPCPRGRETILLVEDDVVLLGMVKSMLEEAGYTVSACSSPESALRVAAEAPDGIDLLITDVIMPNMNGRDLLRNMVPRHPKLRCLYMSGYSGEVITTRGVLESGVHFIQKPFSKKDLAMKVRMVLDEAREGSAE